LSDGGSSGRTGDDAGQEGAVASSDWTLKPTVWVGEVETTVTYPEVLTANAPQKVVLVLGAVTGSVIGGTVTFGSGSPPPPPTDPTLPYPPEPTDFETDAQSILPENWTISPYPAFAYSLVSSTVLGSSLTLAFEPTEIWRQWCAIQNPPQGQPTIDPGLGMPVCTCDASSCSLASGSNRRFDLAVTGDQMQGQLVQLAGPWITVPPAIRLQRVQ
jgi:hypothetical protein